MAHSEFIELSKKYLEGGFSPEKVEGELGMLMRKRKELTDAGMPDAEIDAQLAEVIKGPEYAEVHRRAAARRRVLAS